MFAIEPADDIERRLVIAKLCATRDDTYSMDVLERPLSYDEVAEIFVRVNSLYTQLRGSDLARAQITAKWRNSLLTFEGKRRCCWVRPSSKHPPRKMIAFATGQSRYLTVKDFDQGST